MSKQATCGTPGTALAECLDERDFAGQVFRVEGADSPELIEHLRGDSHRLGESVSAVDDPVPDGRDRGEPRVSFELLDNQPGGRGLVRGLDGARLPPRAADAADDQPGFPATDPFDSAGEDRFARAGHRVHSELQAG